jgi:hypothetical protein
MYYLYFPCFGKNGEKQKGANGLIGATNTPLGDYLLGNILGILSKKVLKKS